MACKIITTVLRDRVRILLIRILKFGLLTRTSSLTINLLRTNRASTPSLSLWKISSQNWMKATPHLELEPRRMERQERNGLVERLTRRFTTVLRRSSANVSKGAGRVCPLLLVCIPNQNPMYKYRSLMLMNHHTRFLRAHPRLTPHPNRTRVHRSPLCAPLLRPLRLRTSDMERSRRNIHRRP